MRLQQKILLRLRPFSFERGYQDFETCRSIHLGSAQTAHKRIIAALDAQQPLAVMRLGAVEARIIMWAFGLTVDGWLGLRYRTLFFETCSGDQNAGVRPRSKPSYKVYAEKCSEAIRGADVLGVWRTLYENVVFSHLQPAAVACSGEGLGPTFRLQDHWMHHLDGRRLLIFSPFEDSIRSQLPHMDKVWEPIGLRWSAQVDVFRFPYLIDDSCRLDWRDVYASCLKRLDRKDYDVAVFGCGGLGIPLAYAAKQRGKVGMHLGGLAQLVFGIYGARHLEHFWHSECINEYWKRPEPTERAQSYQRVEGGCYW